jgi:CO/xanthine dehydrogenase Mo-binding subunit
MARLVRSMREIEGDFEEVWSLVEEDGLQAWPGGAELAAVGRPTPRADGAKRVSGAARYTVDIVLAGMLHTAVLRSPVAHARVTNLDVEAALAAPGVRAAIGPATEVSFGGTPPLLFAEPQYVGQPIAVLAADSPEQAAAALADFALELEPLPFVVELEDALRAQQFTEEPIEYARGDAEAALAAADVRVEVELETPAHLQTPLEPHAAVARWEGGELTVWVSTQGIFDARSDLARRFGVPRDDVRVIAEFVGGGFGGKIGGGAEAILAAELARRSGRPVRLVNDRHEEFLDGGHRGATRQTYRLGARRDGTLVAVDCDVQIGMGVGGVIFRSPLAPAQMLYRCDNVQALTFPLKLNLRARNAFRAPNIMEGITGFEQAIDELAIALDLDALELRRRIDSDVDEESGVPYTAKHLVACYDRAAELAGWAGRERLREPQPDGLLRGMGCAAQIWWGGGGPPAHATIRVGSDGTATVVTGIQDIGTGSWTGMRLVAAEELGLPVERVRVVGGDTGPNVYAPRAAGSMTTASVAPAVRSAAARVRATLLELAADVFEAAPADLELRDGRVRSTDGSLDRDVREVTEKLGDATIEAAGARGPNPDGYRANTFGCQIAQIAVDPGLGEVIVERVVAVHDVGRIVNPLTASSQVEGGILQGMAYALSEERVVDPTTGAPANAHLDDYKVPTISDIPEMVIDFVDEPDMLLSNVGAKGLGEPPIIPTAAAIANAFRHATGRRARALPLTRARVLETLGA